jgi:O-antigen/teichoic acid export membrane protein
MEPLAVLTVGSSDLSLELVAGGLSVFFLALGGVQLGAIAGLERFRCVAFLALLEAAINLVFASVGAVLMGVVGVLSGVTLALAIMSPVKHYLLKGELKKYGIDITYLQSWRGVGIWGFVLPATLVSITAQPVEWILKLRVASSINGYEEVGVFAVVSSLALMVQVLPSQLAASARSIFPSLYSAKDFFSIRKLIISNTLYSGCMGIIVSLPLALFARFLLGLYGESFSSGVEVFYLLLLSYSTAVISMTFTEFLMACGYMWLQYAHRLIWAVVTVVSGLFLFNQSAMGLACSYAFGNFIYVLFQAVTVVWLLSKIKNKFGSDTLPLERSCVGGGVNDFN